MEKSGWVSIQPLSHSREDGERLKPPPATEPGSVPLSNVISCFPVGLKPNSSLQGLSVLVIPLIFSRTGALVLPRWSFLLHPSVILIVWATLRFRTPSLNRKPPVYSTWGATNKRRPKSPLMCPSVESRICLPDQEEVRDLSRGFLANSFYIFLI